jgi:hypothetical protein
MQEIRGVFHRLSFSGFVAMFAEFDGSRCECVFRCGDALDDLSRVILEERSHIKLFPLATVRRG